MKYFEVNSARSGKWQQLPAPYVGRIYKPDPVDSGAPKKMQGLYRFAMTRTLRTYDKMGIKKVGRCEKLGLSCF